MKPEDISDFMDTNLMQEIKNYLKDGALVISDLWDKDNQKFVLVKNSESEFRIVKGFFINQKPVVSLEFSGDLNQLLKFLFKSFY